MFQLSEHVLKRLESLHADADHDLYKDWLNSEFTYPLRALLFGSARDRRAHTVLNLVVIGGGFATSGIAVAAGSGRQGSTASWIVFSIGLLLAVIGGANQLFRPGYRATERTTIAVEMREEGWAFAMAIDSYSDDKTAFTLFEQRVSALQRRIAKISAVQEQSASGSSDGRNNKT